MKMTHEMPTSCASLGFDIVILVQRALQKKISLHGTTHDGNTGVYQKQHSTEPEQNEHHDLHRFPWEPRTTHDLNGTSVNNSSAVHEPGQNDFMSMMTFANQNLRPPSCPCCQ